MKDRALAAAALRNAAPYLRLYQGRVFVIKVGGEAFESDSHPLLEQVAILHRLGIRIVLVHGGGPQITELSEQLGLDPKLVEGRRVTCNRTLEATSMVLNGSVNTSLVAAFRKLGVPAVGLSGVDGELIRAVRRPPQLLANGRRVDFGHVGDIEAISPEVLTRLFECNFLPVLSPLSADASGQLLNINADTVASRLAAALSAEKLIFLTAAAGILLDADDPASLVSFTDVEGLLRFQETGVLNHGMLPKVESMLNALREGVTRVHVISHRVPDSLLVEIFTNEGSGTLVVLDREQCQESVGS